MGYLPSFGSIARVVGGVLVVSLISTAGLLYRYQTSLIYPSSFPSGSKAETLRVFVMLQGTALAKSNEKSLQRKSSPTQTGKAPLEVTDAALAGKRPTVLFLHANAGNMGHRLPLAAVFFKRFGCNVVMLSYRGYGFSTGSPNERGIKIDTQTTLDYIRSHPALSSTLLVAYGQSIGGAVAIDLAARNPASVHALILENTFLSIPELIPHVLPPVRPFAFLCREYWNSAEAICKVAAKVPVLFLSGRQDELVPPAHMDALHAACNSTTKRFQCFAQGTHNDTCIQQGYFETIGEFLLAHVVTLVNERTAAPKQSGSSEESKVRREASGDEDEWVQMSHSELRGTTDPDTPTLSKAPKL
ncbi:hypothetical protein L1887_48211 [Cichorium endivia]|nr:hypothetical protein L1887_48211 [Cichorium endivia]